MRKAENPHEWYIKQYNPDNAIDPRGDLIPLSQAMIDLNDGMNFLYCRPDEDYLETVIFSDTYTLPTQSGIGGTLVDEDDLIDLMDEIAGEAGDSYYEDNRGDKEPLMFGLRIIGIHSNYVDIEAIFAWIAGTSTETEDEYVYEDSWIYGQWGQDVSDECSEEEANADAADLFRRDLRKNVAYRNKFESYYFKNPYTVCFTGHYDDCFSVEIPIENYFPVDANFDFDDLDNPNDQTQNDNLYDLLLFYNYSGSQNYHACLSANEMNFHYEAMADLAEDLLPSPPGNNVIAQIEVGYNGLFSGTSTIFHSFLVVKATKTSIDEEYEDPVPLPDCCQ